MYERLRHAQEVCCDVIALRVLHSFCLLVSNSLHITFLFTKMKSIASFLCLLAVVSSHNIQNAEQQHHNSTERSAPKSRLLSIFGLGGKGNACKNLSKDKKPVRFTATPACVEKIINENAINVADGIRQYLATASCQISNSISQPGKVILHDDNENEDIAACGAVTDLGFRSMVLVQFPDMATYMILNPEKGHWLFTNELSGCDIFVATKPSQPKMPLIVHANFNRLNRPAQQVENLRLKGQNVDKILGEFQMGYVLKVRIHITPEEPIPADYQQYWTDYRNTHQGVTVFAYDLENPVIQASQFFCHYKNAWSCFLKGSVNGVKTAIPM